MKYDLSKIMKRAWEIKKGEDRKVKNSKLNHNDFSALKENEKASFGICLSMAWEEIKKVVVKAVGKVEVIKDWFMNKKFGIESNNFGDKLEVIKETEKAVLGNVYYKNGMPMEIWVPKICLY